MAPPSLSAPEACSSLFAAVRGRRTRSPSTHPVPRAHSQRTQALWFELPVPSRAASSPRRRSTFLSTMCSTSSCNSGEGSTGQSGERRKGKKGGDMSMGSSSTRSLRHRVGRGGWRLAADGSGVEKGEMRQWCRGGTEQPGSEQPWYEGRGTRATSAREGSQGVELAAAAAAGGAGGAAAGGAGGAAAGAAAARAAGAGAAAGPAAAGAAGAGAGAGAAQAAQAEGAAGAAVVGRRAVVSMCACGVSFLSPFFPLSPSPLTLPSALALDSLSLADLSPPSLPSLATLILRGLNIGDSDVFYPPVFEGEWECTSQLISVDTPEGEGVADNKAVESARMRLGVPVVYQARFVPFSGRIIADRLWTTQSLVEATVGKGVVEKGEWSPTKPNLLTLTLNGGIRVQSLVTKRSFELSAPGQFDVSEYAKQVFDNTVTVEGPPSVKASGNLTRYRWPEDAGKVDEIQAFQKISMFPVVGGVASERGEGGLSTMDVLSLGMGARPTTVYKYLLRLRRLPAST